MTGRALRCGRRFCVRPYLDNLIVTTGAGAMKSLLVRKRDYRGRILAFDLGYLRPHCGLFLFASMTAPARGYFCARLLRQQFRRQRRRPIWRLCSLMRAIFLASASGCSTW